MEDVARDCILNDVNERLIKLITDINTGKTVKAYLKKYLKHIVHVQQHE